MLEELRCPYCRAPLNEFDVVGDMGRCPKDGMVFRVTGGTLALTSKYGLDIPDLTQNRVDAELGAFRDYERNCRGKLEDCQEKLGWSVEQHAKFNNLLPQSPKLLEIQKTNEAGLFFGLIVIIIGILGIYWASPWVPSQVWYIGDGDWGTTKGLMYNMDHAESRLIPPDAEIRTIAGHPHKWIITGHWHGGFFNDAIYPDPARLWWGLCFFFIYCVFYGFKEPIKYLKATNANGDRPRENARRTKAFEMALTKAMRDAERIKEKRDYQLKEEIRKLNGIIESVREKAESIRSEYTERVRRSQTNRY
jgi:hypothetical protein